MTNTTNSTAEPQFQKPAASIGSGHIVMMRNPKTRRLKPAAKPYEHQDGAHALEEAARLATLHGEAFEVFERVGIVKPPASNKPAQPMPAEPPQKATKGDRRVLGLPRSPEIARQS